MIPLDIALKALEDIINNNPNTTDSKEIALKALNNIRSNSYRHLSELDIHNMSNKYAMSRSDGDREQDRNCYYDYMMGIEDTIKKLNDEY